MATGGRTGNPAQVTRDEQITSGRGASRGVAGTYTCPRRDGQIWMNARNDVVEYCYIIMNSFSSELGIVFFCAIGVVF